jgi:hypothetical protein
MVPMTRLSIFVIIPGFRPLSVEVGEMSTRYKRGFRRSQGHYGQW